MIDKIIALPLTVKMAFGFLFGIWLFLLMFVTPVAIAILTIGLVVAAVFRIIFYLAEGE